MRTSIVHARCRPRWHASCVAEVMDLRRDLRNDLSFEDRIDELSRLALLVLLLATLVRIV